MFVCIIPASATPNLIGMIYTYVFGLARVIGLWFSSIFIDVSYLEHQSCNLLTTFAVIGLFIGIQIGCGEVEPASGAAKVGSTGQTARLRGVDEHGAVDGVLNGLPLHNAGGGVSLDLLHGQRGDARIPADAGNVVAIVVLDLAAVLGQVSLEQRGHLVDTVVLPQLRVPPVEGAFCN